MEKRIASSHRNSTYLCVKTTKQAAHSECGPKSFVNNVYLAEIIMDYIPLSRAHTFPSAIEQLALSCICMV